MAAVAYWGTGAAERTGIVENPSPGKIRIICDLLSGACKPSEIKKLMGLGVQVKTLDRLHAKVWIGEDCFIAGSANASKSGLPRSLENVERSNIEAVVLSRDPRLYKELRGWFDDLWRHSTEISKELLTRADMLWKRRERPSTRGARQTVKSLEETKRRLIAQVVEAAKRLCRQGSFKPELTLDAINDCMRNGEWLLKYEEYVDGYIYSPRNPLKHSINTQMGKAVIEGVGAKIQRDGNGYAVRVPVTDKIIRSYTALESFNKSKVAGSDH